MKPSKPATSPYPYPVKAVTATEIMMKQMAAMQTLQDIARKIERTIDPKFMDIMDDTFANFKEKPDWRPPPCRHP